MTTALTPQQKAGSKITSLLSEDGAKDFNGAGHKKQKKLVEKLEKGADSEGWHMKLAKNHGVHVVLAALGGAFLANVTDGTPPAQKAVPEKTVKEETVSKVDSKTVFDPRTSSLIAQEKNFNQPHFMAPVGALAKMQPGELVAYFNKVRGHIDAGLFKDINGVPKMLIDYTPELNDGRMIAIPLVSMQTQQQIVALAHSVAPIVDDLETPATRQTANVVYWVEPGEVSIEINGNPELRKGMRVLRDLNGGRGNDMTDIHFIPDSP